MSKYDKDERVSIHLRSLGLDCLLYRDAMFFWGVFFKIII